ncbi:hypothetical protein NDK43_30715 [Neobacillus pocheonensis]|uniref:Lipoprotein n=1 Tax=Neobacillus pocheonensis TaxID=363869 RepID=A0ABT0WHR7_9BACI|nr:hypothetical protein [Neobacillus pocheonensis]
MKKLIGIILLAGGFLVGCGTNTVSENAKVVNEYTQSDIGTKLEKIGCEFSTNHLDEKQIKITVNKCSSISNHDAITYIKENLADKRDGYKIFD